MEQTKINEIISKLTLEEKASLTTGKDNWFTKDIEKFDVPGVRTSDGPHGLRTQEGETTSLAEESSVKAVCFPAACATAASFDRDLIYRMGQALGQECQALGVNVLLGPGINIKRSPLCGRNFEYFSEDPMVAGELGAAFVNGVQDKGAGACLKHFFANSQEHRRMSSSSEMDERTMREIYLAAFETVIKKSQPWTVMASYNKIGGVYSTENKKYLTDVLRGEWGFEGMVMSDWGATHDRKNAVEAGCALTMPSAADTDIDIINAVKKGTLKEEKLDEVCRQILTLAYKAAENHKEGVTFDYEGDHELAREIAANSIILLKNEENILPLKGNEKVAFIGGFAGKPRYQGGGSSHINSYKVSSALEAAKESGYPVLFAQGYDEKNTEPDEVMIAEAVDIAKEAEIAVVFAGLPDAMETEGVDRRHMNMPKSHNALIEAVCEVNPQTIVILHNGAPVEMPWVGMPKAVIETYLGGQAVGEAVVDILYGRVNPSGRLPETFPKKLADNPSYLSYFGEGDKVNYDERYYVGYRYYTSKQMEPLFPFGHGLSYTQFAFSGMRLDKKEMDDTENLKIAVTVENTGNRAGKALVQLYVAPPSEEVIRPMRELKGFDKIELEPGEKKEVGFELSRRAFAHWCEAVGDWRVEDGVYTIQICEDAHTVILEDQIRIHATKPLCRVVYSMDMTMGDFAKAEEGRKALDENIGYLVRGMAAAGFLPGEAVGALDAMGGGNINLAAVEMLAERTGMTTGGASGISVLFSQQVSMLANFIPPENLEKIKSTMKSLNDRG